MSTETCQWAGGETPEMKQMYRMIFKALVPLIVLYILIVYAGYALIGLVDSEKDPQGDEVLDDQYFSIKQDSPWQGPNSETQGSFNG